MHRPTTYRVRSSSEPNQGSHPSFLQSQQRARRRRGAFRAFTSLAFCSSDPSRRFLLSLASFTERAYRPTVAYPAGPVSCPFSLLSLGVRSLPSSEEPFPPVSTSPSAVSTSDSPLPSSSAEERRTEILSWYPDKY